MVQYCPYNNRVLVQKVAGIFGLTNINQHFCTYKYIHCPETANTGHALEVGKTRKNGQSAPLMEGIRRLGIIKITNPKKQTST